MRSLHITERNIKIIHETLATKWKIDAKGYPDYVEQRPWAKYDPLHMYNYVMELRSVGNIWLTMQRMTPTLYSEQVIPINSNKRGALDFMATTGEPINIDDALSPQLVVLYVKEMRKCWDEQWKAQEAKEAEELLKKRKNKILTRRIRDSMRLKLFAKHFQRRIKRFVAVLSIIIKIGVKRAQLFQLKAAAEVEDADKRDDEGPVLMTENLKTLLDAKLDKSRFLEFYDQELVRFNTNFREFKLTLQSQALVQESLNKKMDEIESVKYIILNEIEQKKELILKGHAQQAAIYTRETQLAELIETTKAQFAVYTIEVENTRKTIEYERTMNEKIRINLSAAQAELKQTKEALKLIRRDVTKAIEGLEEAAKAQIAEVFDAKEWVSKSINKKKLINISQKIWRKF